MKTQEIQINGFENESPTYTFHLCSLLTQISAMLRQVRFE